MFPVGCNHENAARLTDLSLLILNEQVNTIIDLKTQVLAGVVDLAHKVASVPFLHQFRR